jgi:hypothetical protein
MPRVAAAERWHFELRPQEPLNAKDAGKLADFMGVHVNTVMAVVNRGLPPGEAFMAAWCAVHPMDQWTDLFDLVPPARSRQNVRKEAKVSTYFAGYPKIPTTYAQALDAGLQAGGVTLDGEVHKVVILSWAAPESCEPWGKDPGFDKDQAVKILGFTAKGDLVLYPATRLDWAQEILAPAFKEHGMNAGRIKWREGSEPGPNGRIAAARYFTSTSA